MPKKKIKIVTNGKEKKIPTEEIRKELQKMGIARSTSYLKKNLLEKKIVEEGVKMVEEIAKRSSMRERQGRGAWYFNRPTVERGVFNEPLKNTEIVVERIRGQGVNIDFRAFITTTVLGKKIDIIGVMQEGTPPIEKRDGLIFFPMTKKTNRRSVAKYPESVKTVERLIPKKAIYARNKNGAIKMVYTKDIKRKVPIKIKEGMFNILVERIKDIEIEMKSLKKKVKIGDIVKTTVE